MKNVVYALLLCCLFNACKSDFEDLEVEDWKPILALPLVYSEITVDDVLTELNHPEEVIILEDGTVALNYKGSLASFNPEEVLHIEDQQFEELVVLGATEAAALDLATQPLDFPVNVPIEINLDPAEVQVMEVLISGGTFNLDVTREQDELVSGTLTINELLDQNMNPLTVDIQGTSSVGTPESFSVDLTGYTLEPTFIPPYTNQMSLSGVLSLENNDSNTAVAGDLLAVDVSLTNLSFAHITGDFGNLVISSDIDTVTVNLFENIESGTFALTNAIISLDVTNSFGLPFDVELGEVVSINQNSGVESQLFLSDISLNGQQTIGGNAENEVFVFDNGNSDVSSLFDPAPVDVIFDIEAIGNPNGSPSPDNPNFITSESDFEADIDLILPLEGYALEVALVDTVDASISFDQYSEIDSVEFKLTTTNGFPLDVMLQAYFLDENSVVTDSLFVQSSDIIAAAEVNGNGDVTGPSEEITYFTFQNERAEALDNVEKVHLVSVFNSTNSFLEQVIRIEENQVLDIELGVKIFGKAEL